MFPLVSIVGITAISVILGAPYVSAYNDWDVPCLHGSCTYESGDGISSPFHVVAIVS